MLTRTARFVERQLHGVTLGPQEFVTLGGKVGKLPVAIHNGLGYPVKVGLAVHSYRTIVKGVPPFVLIPAHSTSEAVKLSVRTTGSELGKIRLALTSPSSPRVQLPTSHLTINVQPTDFGTVALVICAAALAVFVIASAVRAIRSGRPGPADPAGPGVPGTGGPAGPAEHADFADRGDRREYPDTVLPDPPELTSAGPAAHDLDWTAPARRPTEER